MSVSSRRWALSLATLAIAGTSFGAGLTAPGAKALTQLKASQQRRAEQVQQRLINRREALGLQAQHGFELRTSDTDQFGILHARFTETYEGIPVFGAEIVTHTTSSGEDLPDTEALAPGLIKASPTPDFDGTHAEDMVRAEMALKGAFTTSPTAKLIWFPERVVVPRPNHAISGVPNAADMVEQIVGWHLAYRVHAEAFNDLDGTREEEFIIDAHSGDVLKHWDALQTAGVGHSQYSGTVSIETWFSGSTYYLLDESRGDTGNFTYNGNRTTGSIFYYTDTDNDWGNGTQYPRGTSSTTNATGETAAVDAAYGLQVTWDYYGNVQGRAGIDGLGTATFSRVHYSNSYDNAFWNDSCFCMTYGDGSGPPVGFNTMTELDVAGHEMSHGVTANSAGLIYTGESGGLNEANSDIHGTMVEFYASAGATGSTIPNTGGNFTIGEQLNPTPLRYMYKPSKDGASRDAWAPDLGTIDVHYSSGPMNRAFYFLSQGAHSNATPDDFSTPFLPGGMSGIGNDSAARIWYRALTVYLTPGSNYLAARTAALRAAADLHGTASTEYAAVANAFAAINVGYSASTFDDLESPVATSSVTGTSGIVTLNADATDNVGVTQVDFYVDGIPVGSAYSRPFSIAWDSLDVDNGSHQLDVVAYDRAGNYGVGDPSTGFTVTNVGSNAFPNGNFEQGAAGWTTTPSVINYPAAGGHRGNGYAWLDGYGAAHSDSISQVVTIPSGVASVGLSFFLDIESADVSGVAHDTFTVTVRNPADNAVLQTLATWSNIDATGFYIQREFNLSAFAGQQVKIQFDGVEDASLTSSFKVDDIRLESNTPDTHPPESVAFVRGSSGTLWFGTEIFDDGAITQVDYLVDGSPSVSATLPTVATPVSASTFSGGAHVLVSKVTDASGNVAFSNPFPFTIDSLLADPLTNPSFETGTNAAFGTNNGSAPPWVINAPAGSFIDGSHFGNAFTNSGVAAGQTRLAILGGLGVSETATLSQNITLPVGGTQAKLDFILRIFTDWTDGVSHDSLSVDLIDASTSVVIDHLGTFSNIDETAGTANFVRRTLVLPTYSSYSTSNVALRLTATESGTGGHTTRFRIDDFHLKISNVPDTAAPTVVAHASGTYGPIALSADASDDFAVKQVEFFVDGNSAGVSLQKPYTGTWTPPADGTYTLTAVATDYAGNSATSAPVSFTITAPVADTTAPTIVSIAATGAYETATLTALASDDVAVTSIELFVDGAFVAHCDALYDNPCSIGFDARGLSAGSHTLMANARDGWNNVGSATTTFNHDPVQVALAPVGALLYQGDTQTFTATVSNTDSPAQPVTYAVQEGASGGTVTAAGVYTAPASRGLFHVVGTSTTDPNASGSATATVYTVDTNDNGVIDAQDMALMAAAYGTTSPPPNVDLDRSSAVDDTDLNLFNAHF